MYPKITLIILIITVFSVKSDKNILKTFYLNDICAIFSETNLKFGVITEKFICSRLNFFENPRQIQIKGLVSHFDFSHNQITLLNSTNAFNLTTLQHLDYSYNRIKNISNDFFDNLINLESLNLANNNLNNITFNLNHNVKLRSLNLASNNLYFIPTNFFEALINLEDLNLSFNNLGSYFFQLKSQILPPTLKTLFLNGINFKNVTSSTFANLTHLKSLTLVDNPLEEMPQMSLKSLEYLDISGTEISKITNLNFSLLKEFKMNRLSRLTVIGPRTFVNLINLETLIIENNENLTNIDPLIFGFLNFDTVENFSLRKLSLARNNISELSGAFEILFRKLDKIFLEENPWDCQCGLIWLTHLENIGNQIDFRCSGPPQNRYKIISELKPQEFVCLENRNLNLPTVTSHNWLFPLIGALSIIVLILVGVLIYLGPYTNQFQWTRSIGPDSPYNRITIEPYEESSRHL